MLHGEKATLYYYYVRLLFFLCSLVCSLVIAKSHAKGHQCNKLLITNPDLKLIPVPKGTYAGKTSGFYTINFFGDIIYKEGKDISRKLNHPIEIMQRPVTQELWVKVMGDNPSQFAKEEHLVNINNIENRLILMQPNNPVENVTPWSSIVFANRLSEIYNLRPTYDLSETKWEKGTRAEDGTLWPETGKGKVKIIAPNGNYHQAEGFRLPTKYEQEYLLLATKTHAGNHLWQESSATKYNAEERYIWYALKYPNLGEQLDNLISSSKLNSKPLSALNFGMAIDRLVTNVTLPIEELDPLILNNGQKLYGLPVFTPPSHEEWSWNWFLRNTGVMGIITRFLNEDSIAPVPSAREGWVGFRLVRNVGVNTVETAPDQTL